jgi:hypothetical protein
LASIVATAAGLPLSAVLLHPQTPNTMSAKPPHPILLPQRIAHASLPAAGAQKD